MGEIGIDAQRLTATGAASRETSPVQPLSFFAALAFAATSIPIGALQLALTVHLPRYFASHMGLSLAAVGAAFALVRALDIPIDPLLGLAVDRTRTGIGRYRPWAIGGAPVLMAALYVLMHPPVAPTEAFLVGALLVMFLGYSAMYLAQIAWAGALAPSYAERSRLFALLISLGVIGAVGVLVAPALLTRFGLTEAQAVQAMVWFVIVTTPLTTIAMVARTPERPRAADEARFRLADYVRLAMRPNVLRLLASDLFIQLGPNWMAALYLFDFTTAHGFSAADANLLLLIYIAAGFVGAPLGSWLAGRLNKHRALMVCTSAFALCVAGTTQLPDARFLPAALLMTAAGAMFSGFLVLLRSLAADIADEAQLETGREWMGLVFALTNATTKLATAAGVFLTFQVLAATGFDAREGAVNTPQAIRALELAFVGGPVLFVLLGGLCFVGYRLDGARHAQIRRELDARDLAAGRIG